MAAYFTEEEFLGILKSYLLTLLGPLRRGVTPGMFFLEKTPSHALYIKEIVKLLPNAKFIHVVRDPRDVVSSLIAASRSWGAHWAPKDAKTAAQWWRRHVTLAHNAGTELPESQFLEIRYEELKSSPREVIKRSVDFLGLRWSEAEIEKAINENKYGSKGTTIRIGGEAAKQFGDAVTEPKDFVRGKRAKGWYRELSLMQKYQIWRMLRRDMSKLGYDWSFFTIR